MVLNQLKICTIYTGLSQDYESLAKVYGNSGVSIVKTEPITDETIPTLIIGWDRVKFLFPNQKIENKIINDYVQWTFSSVEDSNLFISDSKSFVDINLQRFYETPIQSYDYLLNGDINEFLLKIISKKLYLFFHLNCCYIYNGIGIYAINLDSLDENGIKSENILLNLINSNDCVIFNHKNLCKHIDCDQLTKRLISVENVYWTKYKYVISYFDLSKNFLNEEVHRYVPYFMSLLMDIDLSYEEERSCKRQAVRDIITNWLSSQAVFFNKTYRFTDKKIKTKWNNYKQYTKTEYSDKRGILGRIYAYQGFNTQNLPKDSVIRKDIISRFDGGKILKLDYVSFETKLSLYLSKDIEFIEKYKDKDLHFEISKIIFKTDNPTPLQRKMGKDVNHAIIYGGGDNTIIKILGNNILDTEESLVNIKSFLQPILKTVELTKELYSENGFLVSDFGILVKPDKKYAAYQHFVSLTASEIVVDKLFELKEFLKNKKSKFMFQIYDAFVLDIHPSELNIVTEIVSVLNQYKGFHFSIDYKMGDNYFECGE